MVVEESSPMQLLRLGWSIDSDWEKVRHLAVGDLWIQHHVRSEKIRVSKMSGLENPSDAQTKYFGPEPLLRHTKACSWVLVGGTSSSSGDLGCEGADVKMPLCLGWLRMSCGFGCHSCWEFSVLGTLADKFVPQTVMDGVTFVLAKVNLECVPKMTEQWQTLSRNRTAHSLRVFFLPVN